jgi:uncharacterized damage-inducible protein DinB
MALKDALLPEFDHEMAVTRRLLERVPLHDTEWQPHAKSMTIGVLATHLAELPGWAPVLIKESGFDIGGDHGEGPKTKYRTTTALLAAFDANVKAARELLAAASDGELLQPWTLRDKGKEVFTLPRVATLRSFLLSHTIHHRGQMSVYLRLRDVPVPSIYGPSADER